MRRKQIRVIWLFSIDDKRDKINRWRYFETTSRYMIFMIKFDNRNSNEMHISIRWFIERIIPFWKYFSLILSNCYINISFILYFYTKMVSTSIITIFLYKEVTEFIALMFYAINSFTVLKLNLSKQDSGSHLVQREN